MLDFVGMLSHAWSNLIKICKIVAKKHPPEAQTKFSVFFIYLRSFKSKEKIFYTKSTYFFSQITRRLGLHFKNQSWPKSNQVGKPWENFTGFLLGIMTLLSKTFHQEPNSFRDIWVCWEVGTPCISVLNPPELQSQSTLLYYQNHVG